jgi:hypothetical protein
VIYGQKTLALCRLNQALQNLHTAPHSNEVGSRAPKPWFNLNHSAGAAP